MPCYHPISAWQLLNRKTAKGKPSISFKNPFAKATADRVGIQVPCGQCIGCRLERSRQWAIRCVHESKQYERNAFITLTYSPDYLPKDGSLHKDHFQKFMKRLRKKISGVLNEKIRFFHCGEYGEVCKTCNETKNKCKCGSGRYIPAIGRPHYHACIFGFDFPDKTFYSERGGCRLYRSVMLEELWPVGYSTVGDVTFESAAYVARYITKKINGEKAEEHYKGKLPEYITMSRGGNVKGSRGIGAAWFNDYSSDVFPSDEVILRGKVMRPPRAYDRWLEIDDNATFQKIKVDRKAKAVQNSDDNTMARLRTKEQCKIAQFKLLKRGIENET